MLCYSIQPSYGGSRWSGHGPNTLVLAAMGRGTPTHAQSLVNRSNKAESLHQISAMPALARG
jgi:hypothetical protein